MHVDGRHPGLQQYRAKKEQDRKAAEVRKEIRTQNPKVDPNILERVVKTRLEKEQAAEQKAADNRRRHSHKPTKKSRPRKERPINNTLADKLAAIKIK